MIHRKDRPLKWNKLFGWLRWCYFGQHYTRISNFYLAPAGGDFLGSNCKKCQGKYFQQYKQRKQQWMDRNQQALIKRERRNNVEASPVVVDP